MNIRLYINNKLVDLDDSTTLPMTYQVEDFSNPTIIKAAWSKTVAIKGTDNNNKIFAEIYKLDRMQHYAEITGGEALIGVNFDPSKRTPFKLYVNADIAESGYIQLTDVSINNSEITYNVTLYGGIADFFYGLKYNEDGTQKTLADLRYFIKENNIVLPEDREFDFTINKELVYTSFNKDWTTDNDELLDYLAFIPAYNGLYSDFDSSKCLINTNGQHLFPNSVTEDNVTYTSYNGFGLASLNKDYTEWQMKDLRSYHQRPAIKVNKLIETICREENSGYQVNFDPKFFNDDNPYWSKSFIALPLLTSNDYEQSLQDFDSVSQYNSGNDWFGNKNSNIKATADVTVNVTGTNITSNNGIIDLTNVPVGSTINLSTGFQLFANAPGATESTLNLFYGTGGNNKVISQIYTVYLAAVNADTNQEIGHSSAYQIQTNQIYVDGEKLIYQPSNGAAVSIIQGSFQRTSGNYKFVTKSGEDTLYLSLNDCPIASRIKLELRIIARSYRYDSQDDTDFKISSTFTGITPAYLYYCDVNLTNLSGSLSDPDSLSSGKTFTKDTFLKTEKTPADYLIDYCKLFGLYFVKDVNEKKVEILTRDTFFTGKIHNYQDRLDLSKDLNINPILFDKKYYRMYLQLPDTKFSERYDKQYSQIYGQKRVSTGYNFNYETKDIYSDNMYQTTIPAIDSNRLYRQYYNATQVIPSFLVDNCTYELYNADESTSIDIYGNVRNSVEWNKLGQDVFAKSVFFSGDYDLEEISNCLLFYNGNKQLIDSNGNDINFWITDDLPEMKKLNEEACYLYTESEFDINNNQIAIKVNELPQYLNCITSSNTVIYSFDFGMPKEMYIDGISYNENATIYNNYWSNFYYDQLHIDTKKLTCYVKLDIMNQDKLRDFYWFDNGIWILNKVNDYDPCSDNTVRSEFIKIQDKTNYTNN